MKKVFTLAVFAGVIVFGASCSKKYDCTCTNYDTGAQTVDKMGGASKDIAAASCIAKSNSDRLCALSN